MKRVIVAEDEPYLARMLRLALTRSGYRVQTATHGKDAWEMLSADAPDAFITAATLPGIGGVDLCRRIRRDLPHRDMPTIIMTGRAEENDYFKLGKVGRVEGTGVLGCGDAEIVVRAQGLNCRDAIGDRSMAKRVSLRKE